MRRHDFDKARLHFENFLKFGSMENPEAIHHVLQNLIVCRLQGINKRENLERCVKDCNMILSRTPEDLNVHLAKINALTRLLDFRGAGLAIREPVGEDQKQHLELSRDIAQKFNLDFNAPNFLRVPEPLIQKNFSRIMSLKDGTNKMSKSDSSDLSRINLTDNKDQIVNKIKKAKTDNDTLPEDEKNLSQRPEVENLLGIYSSLSNQSLKNSINEFSGKNFSEFKEKLAELVVEKISPISIEINKLQKDNSYIDNVLKEGGERANAIASKKVEELKRIIGF
jgi:tryptophanyl-tRNA synthetase